jgi:hypothetical protein
MNHKDPSPHSGKRFAMATMLLALLGTTGMTAAQRVMRASRSDVASASGSTIIPDPDQCANFACER